MTRRSFRSELKSLVFVLASHPKVSADPLAGNVVKDFDRALNCCYVRKTRRNLIWGLLVGRSLDTFTVFFLDTKRIGSIKSFNNRILRICSPTSPLTADPAIETDLLRVKEMPNDLFHNAGRHFNDSEIEDFVFTSTKCIQQLISDL